MNIQESTTNRQVAVLMQAKPVSLARRASRDSIVKALPQPGGADILREKKRLLK